MMLEGLRFTVGRGMLDEERVEDWKGPKEDCLEPADDRDTIEVFTLVVFDGKRRFDADTLSLTAELGSIFVRELDTEGMGGTWLGLPPAIDEARLEG